MKLNLLLTCLAAVALLSSCSVEKRVHMSGYHINWHHKQAKLDAPQSEIAMQAQDEIVQPLAAQQAVEEVSLPEHTAHHVKESSLDPAEVKAPRKPAKAIRAVRQMMKTEPVDLATLDPSMSNIEENKTAKAAEDDDMALIWQIVAAVSLAAGIIAVLISFFFFLSWFWGIIGLATGIVSLIIIKQNPEYQGKKLALWGIIASALGMLLAVVFIILRVLFQLGAFGI